MKSIPRIRFAHLPTPIEPLPNLSAALHGPKIWIKRDDQTGLAFGGNKTRKLEFLVAEALANGARTLITGGGVQSNHCRQTAAAAAKFNLDCILVLGLTEGFQKNLPYSGNLLLDKLLRAEIVWAPPGERDIYLQKTFDNAWGQGRRPYLIPYGGSNPVGASGYAYAVEEVKKQYGADTSMPQPDWVVVASSSGGTQAGLVAGARIFNFHSKILGISIDESEKYLKEIVASLALSTCDLLGEPIDIYPEEVQVNDKFIGPGYGVLSELEISAISLFAEKEGIMLDPVYTGRAAGGLLSLIENAFFKEDETILFWHTGGSPALFADQYRSIASHADLS